MPAISRPPPTRRRFAAAAASTAALFLFPLLLLLPTCLPRAAAQPASAPPSDGSSSATPALDTFNPCLRAVAVFLFLLSAYSVFILRCSLAPEGSVPAPSLRRLASPRGPDPPAAVAVETFPTVAYSAVKGHKVGEASLACAVCLDDFEDDDMLRLIPMCDHAFHPDCIGAWLGSHTTCPVCRAELASEPAGDSESQRGGSGTEPPRVEVAVEAAPPPPDAGAAERRQRGREREGIQPPDLWDKNESNNRSRTRGSGQMRRFSRSHSTGHSLIRPGEDTERFTLRLPAEVRRLPAEVRRQLMDRAMPDRAREGSSRRGYRCGGEGSSRGRRLGRQDRLDRAAKSERWAFNRMPSFFARVSSALSPRVAADGGGGGSSRGSAQQARPAI